MNKLANLLDRIGKQDRELKNRIIRFISADANRYIKLDKISKKSDDKVIEELINLSIKYRFINENDINKLREIV